MSSLIMNRKDNDNRYYTQSQTNDLLNTKSDKTHTHPAETVLTNQNLNTVTTPGFYSAAGGNTVANKPVGVTNFGMEVIHRAYSQYYTQKLYTDDSQYTRQCINGTWKGWTKDELTDTKYDLNKMINELSVGTSTPTDNDYYIAQYAGGGVIQQHIIVAHYLLYGIILKRKQIKIIFPNQVVR